MDIANLRYFLTDYKEKYIFSYQNYMLLVHPALITDKDLILQIEDDIRLMPSIAKTKDGTSIKFYLYDYEEEIYSKSEILAFIYATINSSFTIIKGLDKFGYEHFYLQKADIIFDPALAIVTRKDIYNTIFKDKKVIKQEDILTYLGENNNLAKYYKKEKKKDFSLNFALNIRERFNKKVQDEYRLDGEKYEYLKNHFSSSNFILLRQVLTQQRQSYLKSDKIAIHPEVDASVLWDIKNCAQKVCALMKNEYKQEWSFFCNTIGNCYGLSIMFNLFDGSFKLVQGGIFYEKKRKEKITKCFYQHSWLEKDNFVYDPALKIVTLKDLYYKFFSKQKEYSKEDTQNILRRIGFNLTHFEDFLNGKQIGNNTSIMYRSLLQKVDSPEMLEEGEALLSLVRKYNS